MVAKLWYLKKVDLFSELSEDEMETLGNMTHMEEVSSNQPIYFPGDTSDTVYILKKGRVRISRSTPEGRRITLAVLEPGEIFGELALTGEKKRDTTAETMEDTLICSASRDRFVEFLSEHPEVSFEITRIIGDRRRQIESKIENLIFRDAPGRLAYVLVDLFEHHATESGKNDAPAIEFSHEEIANLAGLTRPTTTHLLNDLQDQNIITLGRKRIQLEDFPRLQSRVDGAS